MGPLLKGLLTTWGLIHVARGSVPKNEAPTPTARPAGLPAENDVLMPTKYYGEPPAEPDQDALEKDKIPNPFQAYEDDQKLRKAGKSRKAARKQRRVENE